MVFWLLPSQCCLLSAASVQRMPLIMSTFPVVCHRSNSFPLLKKVSPLWITSGHDFFAAKTLPCCWAVARLTSHSNTKGEYKLIAWCLGVLSCYFQRHATPSIAISSFCFNQRELCRTSALISVNCAGLVVGISCAVLVFLYTFQWIGTNYLGWLFSPIIVAWLLFNAIIGIYNIAHWHPGQSLQGVNWKPLPYKHTLTGRDLELIQTDYLRHDLIWLLAAYCSSCFFWKLSMLQNNEQDSTFDP